MAAVVVMLCQSTAHLQRDAPYGFSATSWLLQQTSTSHATSGRSCKVGT